MNGLSGQIINEYFDASKTGFWKIEKENGVSVRLFADNNMQELLGVPQGLSPEECCAFHQEHVYPEDLWLLREFDQEQIKGNAEVVYRYNHPVYGLVYVRAGGRMTSNVGNQIIYVGYHKELSDTVRFENENKNVKNLIQRNRDMQLQKSQNYYRGLMNKVACGIVEYTMRDMRIQYANSEMLRIVGAKSLEQFQNEGKVYWKSIRFSDRFVIEKLRRLYHEDGSLNYEGTAVGLDGEKRNIMAHIEAITALDGERSFFATFLDITETRTLKSDKHIFDALCKDYVTFFYIDFKKKKLFVLKKNKRMDEIDKQECSETSFEIYDRNFRKYYNEFVDKNSAPDYVQKLCMSSMEKELEKNPTYSYRFNTSARYEKHYFEVFVSRVDGIEDAAIMGYRLIDDIIAEEEKRRLK